MRDGHVNARTQDKIRAAIKVEEIIKKLEAHVLRGAKMTATQVRAAEILARKCVPDLTAQQLTASTTDIPLLQIVKPDAVPAVAAAGVADVQSQQRKDSAA